MELYFRRNIITCKYTAYRSIRKEHIKNIFCVCAEEFSYAPILLRLRNKLRTKMFSFQNPDFRIENLSFRIFFLPIIEYFFYRISQILISRDIERKFPHAESNHLYAKTVDSLTISL